MGMLEIKDFSFSYPKGGREVLHSLNFEIEEGEFLVVCGKSGCGKSTLLRQLKPVLAPFGRKEGQIFFQGKKIEEMDARAQAEQIGYVLQNPDNQIVTDKVWHELAFGLESLGMDEKTIRLRVAEMASYFGIEKWFYKQVTELSGGQKQLLNLASVMAMHPSLLILDEPTSQLDPIAASDFLETIKKINRELGTTIIISEHRLQDVFPAADRVLVLDDGRAIALGTPGEIGMLLKEKKHDMFYSMPAPMQIYGEVPTKWPCPLTVRQGRRWLNASMSGVEEPKQYLEEREPLQEGETVMELKELWFRYEKEGPDVVKGLNLKIKKGELFCLLGGNGSGKSTALSLMCRVRLPYRGKIYLEGKELKKYSDAELFSRNMGVVPQNPQSLFVKKTVEEELYEMLGGKKGLMAESHMDKKTAAMGIAKTVHIDHLLHQHPYDLSGGEQQRLALAKILLLRPKILLMDEPTKGLDNYFKREFAEILAKLKEHGVTIFMISHDIEFCAEYADRCGLFFDGKVISGSTTREFFAGNNFYTTSANRMARHFFPEAVTVKDVIRCCKENL